MAGQGDAFYGTNAGQGESRMPLYIAVSMLGLGLLGATGELLCMLPA